MLALRCRMNGLSRKDPRYMATDGCGIFCAGKFREVTARCSDSEPMSTWLHERLLGCTHSTGHSRRSTSLEIGCRVTSSLRRRDWLLQEETTPGSSSSSAAGRRPPERSAPPRSAASTTSHRACCCGGARSTSLVVRRPLPRNNSPATKLSRRESPSWSVSADSSPWRTRS